MSLPVWGEYARVQHQVSQGNARDEVLDAFLIRYFDNRHPFDPHDCRRRLKNLDRNTARKERDRTALLVRHADRLGPALAVQPVVIAVRRETAAAVRRAAGDDWPLLRDTLDGEYETIAAAAGVPVGTLKSSVSRRRSQLRMALTTCHR